MCMRISASNKNVVVSPYENMLDSVVVFRSDFLELDTVEKESAQIIDTLNKRIDTLENENLALKKENQLLKDDNARLKSIINNDSSNTSLPPSTDPKGGKPANSYNGRKKTGRKAGGQKGHKGTTLTKAEIEEKIACYFW